jgi:hypothetical protein
MVAVAIRPYQRLGQTDSEPLLRWLICRNDKFVRQDRHANGQSVGKLKVLANSPAFSASFSLSAPSLQFPVRFTSLEQLYVKLARSSENYTGKHSVPLPLAPTLTLIRLRTISVCGRPLGHLRQHRVGCPSRAKLAHCHTPHQRYISRQRS